MNEISINKTLKEINMTKEEFVTLKFDQALEVLKQGTKISKIYKGWNTAYILIDDVKFEYEEYAGEYTLINL